jgi:hypothetical protein
MDFGSIFALVCAGLWLVFIFMAVVIRLTRWAWAEHVRFFRNTP